MSELDPDLIPDADDYDFDGVCADWASLCAGQRAFSSCLLVLNVICIVSQDIDPSILEEGWRACAHGSSPRSLVHFAYFTTYVSFVFCSSV